MSKRVEENESELVSVDSKFRDRFIRVRIWHNVYLASSCSGPMRARHKVTWQVSTNTYSSALRYRVGCASANSRRTALRSHLNDVPGLSCASDVGQARRPYGKSTAAAVDACKSLPLTARDRLNSTIRDVRAEIAEATRCIGGGGKILTFLNKTAG